MIALDLQESIKREIEEKILKGVLFNAENGKQREMRVYKQSLPSKSRNEDEQSYFPYIIVRLDKGNVNTDENTVRVLLLFAIYNDGKDRQGHVEVMNCIDKVYQRFAKNDVLDRKFRADADMEWQLAEEQTHPCYFGGMRIDFSLIAARRENEFT